jgi:hypothetical protein
MGVAKPSQFFLSNTLVLFGDLNEITAQSKKEGTTLRRERQMKVFRETMEEFNLIDLGYMGSRYMWSNKRHDEGFTKEHLDRAIANQSWCDLFPSLSVYVLAACSSDHKTCLSIFCKRLRTPCIAKWVYIRS